MARFKHIVFYEILVPKPLSGLYCTPVLTSSHSRLEHTRPREWVLNNRRVFLTVHTFQCVLFYLKKKSNTILISDISLLK